MKRYEIVGISQPFQARSGKYYLHFYLTFEDAAIDGLGVRDVFVEALQELMSFQKGDIVHVMEENRRVVGFLKAA